MRGCTSYFLSLARTQRLIMLTKMDILVLFISSNTYKTILFCGKTLFLVKSIIFGFNFQIVVIFHLFVYATTTCLVGLKMVFVSSRGRVASVSLG